MPRDIIAVEWSRHWRDALPGHYRIDPGGGFSTAVPSNKTLSSCPELCYLGGARGHA